MKTVSRSLCCLLIALLVLVLPPLAPAHAQNPVAVKCGQAIDSAFTADEIIHKYEIEMEVGSRLHVLAISKAGNYQNLRLGMQLIAPNGFVIQGFDRYENNLGPAPEASTEELSVAGVYQIEIKGRTDTGSAYSAFFDCLRPGGVVVSAHNSFQSAVCGSVIDNEFVPPVSLHRYFIMLKAGDRATFSVASTAANYQNLRLAVQLIAPNGFVIQGFNRSENDLDSTKKVETEVLSVDGIYRVYVKGRTDTGSRYTFSVGCTLADGTVVNPGDAMPVRLSAAMPASGATPAAAPAPTVAFSGYGFPGMPPLDFSKTVEIPLASGQSFNGALGSSGQDVFAYTYDATAGSSANLTLKRISGDLSMGVVVINKADKTIVFLAGMPASGSLQARIDFPTGGTYVIGVFRLDIPPHFVGTSGAFEVRID